MIVLRLLGTVDERRLLDVAAYRSRDTKRQGERFADQARYGVIYCALNTATHPCTHAGVPEGGAA
jgi:hypothetical protein